MPSASPCLCHASPPLGWCSLSPLSQTPDTPLSITIGFLPRKYLKTGPAGGGGGRQEGNKLVGEVGRASIAADEAEKGGSSAAESSKGGR